MSYHYRHRVDKRISRNVSHYLLVCTYPLRRDAERRLNGVYAVNRVYHISVVKR